MDTSGMETLPCSIDSQQRLVDRLDQARSQLDSLVSRQASTWADYAIYYDKQRHTVFCEVRGLSEGSAKCYSYELESGKALSHASTMAMMQQGRQPLTAWHFRPKRKQAFKELPAIEEEDGLEPLPAPPIGGKMSWKAYPEIAMMCHFKGRTWWGYDPYTSLVWKLLPASGILLSSSRHAHPLRCGCRVNKLGPYHLPVSAEFRQGCRCAIESQAFMLEVPYIPEDADGNQPPEFYNFDRVGV